VKPPGPRRRPSPASSHRPGPRRPPAPASIAPAFRRPADDPWAFLPDPLRAPVARLGFVRPTPIQAAAFPRVLAGESLRTLAPTGTGKTLVYLLAARNALAQRGAQALILVPTRELAYQVTQMLRELDPAWEREAVLAIGGHPKASQIRRINEGWRILVATPGRLLELLEEKSISLASVALAALDEFDKLIGMGFAEQVATVLKTVPKRAQKLLLSATENDAPEATAAEAPAAPALAGVAGLAALEALPLVSVEREVGSRIMEEAFFFLKSDRKKGELLLAELAATRGQAIVFVGNREKANHLNGLLRLRGIGCRALHGHLLQEERAEAFGDFRSGKFRVLVATDLVARGLDMPEVDLIVNYDLPRNYKDYVHRTGRAARRGRAGRCASFAGPDEYLPMRNIEREFPGPLPVHPAFANRDAWFRDAKRNHDHKVKSAERADAVRAEQGLDG
jgi:superfamily II DNA/RNA helicase